MTFVLIKLFLPSASASPLPSKLVDGVLTANVTSAASLVFAMATKRRTHHGAAERRLAKLLIPDARTKTESDAFWYLNWPQRKVEKALLEQTQGGCRRRWATIEMPLAQCLSKCDRRKLCKAATENG